MKLLTEGIEKHFVERTTKKSTFPGANGKQYDVYRVRLDQLYFNEKNGRIATLISEFKAKNNISIIDRTDVEKYNSIIHDMVRNSGSSSKSGATATEDTKNNIKLLGQMVPIITLNDGRVIDGNRRYTCFRELQEENPQGQFDYIEAFILDWDIENNYAEIKKLEEMLSFLVEARVDYSPIDRILDVWRTIEDEKILSEDEFIKCTGRKKSEIKKDLNTAGLLMDLLKMIHADGQYYLAKELQLDGPLEELATVLNSNSIDLKRRNLLKQIVFANIVAVSDLDMTRYIRNVKTIIKGGNKAIDDFVAEEIETAEEIFDSLPIAKTISRDDINNIRANKSRKEMLIRTMNKHSEKVKVSETRNAPLEFVRNASDKLAMIDTGIIEKLSTDEKNELASKVEEMQTRLERIATSENRALKCVETVIAKLGTIQNKDISGLTSEQKNDILVALDSLKNKIAIIEELLNV